MSSTETGSLTHNEWPEGNPLLLQIICYRHKTNPITSAKIQEQPIIVHRSTPMNLLELIDYLDEPLDNIYRNAQK